jgi:hypothetical protein
MRTDTVYDIRWFCIPAARLGLQLTVAVRRERPAATMQYRRRSTHTENDHAVGMSQSR